MVLSKHQVRYIVYPTVSAENEDEEEEEEYYVNLHGIVECTVAEDHCCDHTN